MILHWYILFNFFLITEPEESSKKIYIAKNDWHVGIILELNDSLFSIIDAAGDFEKFNYIDIGWGDADFYQGPNDFDLYLAGKAILFPTPSVIRIQGYLFTLEQIFNYRDFAIEISITDSQLYKLSEFINISFERDLNNNLIITSEKYNGVVKFYSSVQKYHMFRTCNTWVGEALEASGLNINSSNITTAEHLYLELLEIGKVIKPLNPVENEQNR